MQFKKLVLALVVAIAAPCAFAADLSTGVTVDNIIYVTGSTSQLNGIAIAVSKFCGTNQLITLTDGTATPVGRGWKCAAAAGTTYPNLPGVTGPFVVLKNEGGSLNAITPLRNGTTQTQLDISNCTVTGTTGTCTNPLVAKPEYIGFSDVSQRVFAAKNQLVAQTAGNTYVADIAVGTSQGFGVVVSSALHALLQTDQAVGTGIPSIGKSQFTSLMTQAAGFWSILLPNGTAHAALPLTLARRKQTSGTQAAAELFFLENPCAHGSLGGALSSTAGTAAGQSFADGADTLIVKQEDSTDALLADAASTTAYVIGVASLTSPQPASSWKFVAIDGVHPGAANSTELQKKNIVNGRYAFAYETLLYKSTKSTLSANALSNINIFTNAFSAVLGVGANLSTSNGLFGDPLALNADFLGDTGHYSRSGNECTPPQWQW